MKGVELLVVLSKPGLLVVEGVDFFVPRLFGRFEDHFGGCPAEPKRLQAGLDAFEAFLGLSLGLGKGTGHD